ncbi:homeobox-DDT domain protein RLT3-like [Tripterygium wilfordii]|uniref:homeobox-DDT domain protein RLT3-like n=1 Tax=Tripterygium wilfordii TaxID=458696 RepID=UPI0018F8187F|nr:homeobox-DDT domain protein RLT3-like [Tripterygium wilfordii]
MAIKKKTALQLEALEKFYAKHKYPSQSAIKEISAVLGLSCKQIRGWFMEKRRRDKRIGTIVVPPRVTNREKSTAASSSKFIKPIIIQELLPADYILTKIFWKDGPPLGAEFDSPPSRAFSCCASRNLHLASQETQRATKRRKVSKHVLVDPEDFDKSAPVRKHGIGKGLMTAWRVSQADGGYFPTGVSQVPTPAPPKPPCQNKKLRQFASIMKQRKLENKLKDNKKRPVKTRRVELKKDILQKPIQKERCKLALERVASHSHEHLNQFTMLADDEELELRELQAGPNPLTCEHFAANGLRGCSLCRDVLSKFPPTSVKMKPPFAMQPWDSSPAMVKKLFKAFHFLYTYSVTVDICPFTLDEFAQAFHDKDSLLLAKIHVDLLKLLLSDIETELNSGLWPNLSISCKFLALLHSVENQLYVLEFWRKSLNPLTWMEILRQVLLAAGFGSKKGSLRKEPLSKEMILMKKYGLRPGTLKGELFKLLLDQGNNGLRVSELAKSLPITELNLGCTTEELELLMCTTLASDITLFEKISSSAYRLRISSAKEVNDPQSDIEDSGSVHDDYIDWGSSSSSDSECDSQNFSPKRLEHQNSHKSRGDVLAVCTVIDESQPGEVWMLGLMEGEYSDLSIDEKLNALVALLDILSAGSSIRVEDLPRPAVESVPNICNYGSGGKIKRSSSQKRDMPRPSWVHGQMLDLKEAHTSLEFGPVDSSVPFSKFYSKEDSPSAGRKSKETEAAIGLHPMQSIFLGSDRRYNRYWLFLGPCDEYDPGHVRVYFESSEDGHWEVIDTEEALSALLSVLDDRGTREAHLIESMEKRGASLCQAMSSRLSNDARIRLSQSDHSSLEIVREESSPVSDVDNLCLTEVSKDYLPPCGAISLEVGKKGEDQSQKWSCLQEFDSWIWNNFYLELNTVKYSKRSYIDSLTKCETCHDLYWRDEKHCKSCHTTFELDFDLEERCAVHAVTCREQGYNDMFLKNKVLSSQLQSLKAAVHAIESVIPEDAMVGAWTKSDHRLWVKRLRRTSSLVELLQVVADFAAAIKEDWLYECHVAEGSDTVMQEVIACFPSMPQTSSAFALWLMKLDSLIAPCMEKAHSLKNQEIRSKCTGTRAAKQ